MNKAFTIRFHYAKDHPDFEWRFNYFKKEVLPRILNQTQQDFDICIWCEKHHEELFRSLSPKIKTFQATYEKRESAYFIDYTPFENTVGLERYNIQIGLDSDDLIVSDFFAKVNSLCVGNNKLHISFQPIKLDIKSGDKYLMKQYTKIDGSPVFVLYQPSLANYIFAYHTSHRKIHQFADETILIPEGFCYMSIHDLNDSTDIKSYDRKLK